MVFKPFTHLARQSFAKTFTNGYAQSVVAATQSSYTSSTTPFSPFGNYHGNRFVKPGTSHLHTAFYNASGSVAVASKIGQANQVIDGADGGLAAYYDAWQKQQQPGANEEWKQFQFAKRIGWKTSSAITDGKGKEKEDVSIDRAGLSQASSSSASDRIMKRDEDEHIVSVISSIDDSEVHTRDRVDELLTKGARGAETVPFDPQHEAPKSSTASSVESVSPSTVTSAPTTISEPSRLSSETAESSTEQDGDSYVLLQHIDELHTSERYTEVPPAFESMVKQGIRPTVNSYNALLAAAINLSKRRHQVIPTALDVYSDMLRRKILPDTAFYTTLIQLLSSRAIEIVDMKASLERKRTQFGGFNDTTRFLFRSNEAEYDILAEDDALMNAMRLFDSSTVLSRSRTYSAETNRL